MAKQSIHHFGVCNELEIDLVVERGTRTSDQVAAHADAHIRRMQIVYAPFPPIMGGRVVPSYPWAGTITNDNFFGSGVRPANTGQRPRRGEDNYAGFVDSYVDAADGNS